jgi:hypothetical protein
LQLLLAASCDISAFSDDGRSPVDVATANGLIDMAQKLLLAGARHSSSAAAAAAAAAAAVTGSSTLKAQRSPKLTAADGS